MNLSRHLQEAANHLIKLGAADSLDESRLEVELLYGEAANIDRAHVIASGSKTIDPEAYALFKQLLNRRIAREPLSYIIGTREFYGLTFEVGSGVLIPRPETETLVEAALVAVNDHPRAGHVVRVADIGTGSGAVAISVALHASNTHVFAVDASTTALQWAEKNLQRLGPIDRLNITPGDLLDPVDEPLDVILANLPYVPTKEFNVLPEEIRLHEPSIAIDGGDDGLVPYRRFSSQLSKHLARDAYSILCEIGTGQAHCVQELLLNSLGRPPDVDVRLHKDLQGFERVIEVRAGY